MSDDSSADTHNGASTTAGGSPAPLIGAATPGGARILVIDDEPEIRRAVRGGLVGAHYTVELAATGGEGLEAAARWHPVVVILDLALPDADGLGVLASLRAWSAVPVIVLSVRASDRDKIAALDRGADDYVTKPFSIEELLARIRVALRHAAHAAGGTAEGARFQSEGLVIDFERRRVTVDENEVRLTPTEYEVLKYLAMHAGKVITHRTLLRAVWGPEYESEAHYLRVFIGQLRRKIEPEPSRPTYVVTEPGIGYRLRTP